MNYSKYIDHTLLKPEATEVEIKQLCDEAKKYHFYSVCVNPTHIAFCKKQLKNSGVKVCCVVGFPLGANTTHTKCFETFNAIKQGADEIDMVINIGWLKQKKYKELIKEIMAIKSFCKNKILKVIVETCLLTTDEKIIICKIINLTKANFIKTSTGFNSGGATLGDIKLFKKHVNKKIKIKASGGIKTEAQMIEFINAGASRIGTSKGAELIK